MEIIDIFTQYGPFALEVLICVIKIALGIFVVVSALWFIKWVMLMLYYILHLILSIFGIDI